MSAEPTLAIVVLAAGKGTRMKSDVHKVLHPIAGRAMIDHLLASAAELAPTRQVVVVGSGREQLEQALGGRADIAVQDPQQGTGHAVQQAEAALSGFAGDVLILYGDVPFVRAQTMRCNMAVSSPTPMAGSPRWWNSRTRPTTSALAPCAIPA